MDVEIILPQAPVALVPGVPAQVRVEVRNRSATPLSVRLTVQPNRAGSWARIDAPTLTLAPGDGGTVDVGFHPPADVPPAATVLPFTVRADDPRYGVPVGRATGLVTVTPARRLTAVLSREPARRGTVPFSLSLVNLDTTNLALRLGTRLDPPGQVTVEPTVVELPPGGTGTARLRVRPRGALIGAQTRYVLTVTCHDIKADEDAPPVATAEEDGLAPPRLGRRPAAVLGTVLLVLLAATAVVFGGRIDLPGRGVAGSTAPPPAPVSRPYALVDVFPQQGGTDGRAAADATLARLAAAGMPVRLVDSTTSDQVADGQGGLWVLLQDGLGTVEATRAYCDRYRAVAPKCDVVP